MDGNPDKASDAGPDNGQDGFGNRRSVLVGQAGLQTEPELTEHGQACVSGR